MDTTSSQVEVLPSDDVTVHPLRLALLVRSAEPSPFCRTLTTWFSRQVERRDDFKLDLVDLAGAGDLRQRIAEGSRARCSPMCATTHTDVSSWSQRVATTHLP